MRRVQISLFGQRFTIRSDAEEHYMREIAQFLEEKVRECSGDEEVPEVPDQFLVAAFKVVDDLFRVKKELEEHKSRAEQKSRGLVEILDKSLTKVDNLQGKFTGSGAKQA